MRGLLKRFDRAIQSVHPVENVDFLDGMRRSDGSIENIGIEKAFFRLRKNARFGLRSEIALFDPPIRLHKNWPQNESELSPRSIQRSCSRFSGGPVAGKHRQHFFDPTGSNTITIVRRIEKNVSGKQL